MTRAPTNNAEDSRPAHLRRRPWLVIFNCQAMGLANCLNLLSDQIRVEYLDPTMVSESRDVILARLDNYERVIIAPTVETSCGIEFGHHVNVCRIPAFHFSGYHPDLCHLTELGGPLRGEHSIIAVAAFLCGLDDRQAFSLYRADIYAAMGYLEQWDSARAFLLNRYADAGLDISQFFIEWSRSGPFTCSPDHPKIQCLRDIAKAVLAQAGMEIMVTGLSPHDNTLNAAIYPVYPEIGSSLGVRGSYLFKLPLRYHMIGLEEFIQASFEFYRDCMAPAVTAPYQPLLARAIAVINATRL